MSKTVLIQGNFYDSKWEHAGEIFECEEVGYDCHYATGKDFIKAVRKMYTENGYTPVFEKVVIG